MLEIATMAREEAAFAVDLAAAEGWNPGLGDAGAFYDTDPEGFFVARLAGEPVGCISAVSYPGAFGFIGLFIVVPDRRGQGIGTALWRKALGYLEDHVIGLDGVVEQQHNYARAGFATYYRNVRYVLTHAPRFPSRSLTPIGDVPRAALEQYDRQCFPTRRERFLDGWLSMADSIALASVESGRVRGYGVARRCRDGGKIGPLFADDADVAERLFTALCNEFGDRGPVYLDIPEINEAALALVSRHSMQAVFETARMYRGEPSAVNTEKIYGVTTFELG